MCPMSYTLSISGEPSGGACFPLPIVLNNSQLKKLILIFHFTQKWLESPIPTQHIDSRKFLRYTYLQRFLVLKEF